MTIVEIRLLVQIEAELGQSGFACVCGSARRFRRLWLYETITAKSLIGGLQLFQLARGIWTKSGLSCRSRVGVPILGRQAQKARHEFRPDPSSHDL